MNYDKEIRALRRREREAPPHSRQALHLEQRRQILELGVVAQQILPMVYWSQESVPEDELEMVYESVTKTVAHMEKLIRCSPVHPRAGLLEP